MSFNLNDDSDTENSIRLSKSHFGQRIVTSFEDCNVALYDMDEVDIYDYIELARYVPYDSNLGKYSVVNGRAKWIEGVIMFLVKVSSYDHRAFKISVDSLSCIGIDSSTSESFLRKLFSGFTRQSDSKREKQFLKYHKLQENVDYIVMSADLNHEIVEIGHNITRIALYRIIGRYYGMDFLEAVLIRMSQILYYFNEYKKNYKSKYIESLRKTIDELNNDINLLTNEMQRKYASNVLPMIEFQNQSDIDSYSNELNNSDSSIASNMIMNEKEYHDELSTIHTLIETKINRVDDRLSDVNVALVNITSKIEDLVSSITMVSDEVSRNSRDRESMQSNMVFRDSLVSNASSSLESDNSYSSVVNHVESIFSEYKNFGMTPPIEDHMDMTHQF